MKYKITKIKRKIKNLSVFLLITATTQYNNFDSIRKPCLSENKTKKNGGN